MRNFNFGTTRRKGGLVDGIARYQSQSQGEGALSRGGLSQRLSPAAALSETQDATPQDPIVTTRELKTRKKATARPEGTRQEKTRHEKTRRGISLEEKTDPAPVSSRPAALKVEQYRRVREPDRSKDPKRKGADRQQPAPNVPSPVQADPAVVRDKVDGYLKSLMGRSEYGQNSAAGSRLRDAVTEGWRVAYPGIYRPGSFNRMDFPVIGLNDLQTIVEGRLGTRVPGARGGIRRLRASAPSAGEGRESGAPENGSPQQEQAQAQVAGALEGSDLMTPGSTGTDGPRGPILDVPGAAVGGAFLLLEELLGRQEATDPPPTSLPHIPPDLEDGQPAPSPDRSGEEDEPFALPGGEEPRFDGQPPPFPDQSDELPQGYTVQIEPGDRGGHLVHGTPTPAAERFRGSDKEQADIEGEDSGLRLTGQQRAEFDAYMNGRGGELLDQRTNREIERIERAESYVWQQLSPYKNGENGGVRTNGLRGNRKRLYTWDGAHGDIEVWSNQGVHLGAIDGITGEWISRPKHKKNKKITELNDGEPPTRST